MDYTDYMKKLYLVTGNQGKLKEWQQILPADIELESVDIDLAEIQSVDPEEIVIDKARRAYAALGKPVVVEDVSLGLDKLNGLPGPFVKFFIEKLGRGALYQLAGAEGEGAVVSCSIAYFDGEQMITARGDVRGTIVSPRGDKGFGFAPSFVPEGETETYAEMDDEKKLSINHRSKAIHLFLEKLSAKQLL